MTLRGIILGCILLILSASAAAADESALNKEGYWLVGRGDAESTSCIASTNAEDGTMLLIQVQPGHFDFIVGKDRAMRKSKAGVLIVDGARFAFAPDYSDDRKTLFFEDPGARAITAVKSARQVIVEVEGHELLNIVVADTGLAGALDATAACAEGKSGWWGPGVVAQPAQPKPDAEQPMAMHKGGVWQMESGVEPGVCSAAAPLADGFAFVLVAADGQMSFGIGAPKAMKRGRKGRVETDKYSFDFTPGYDGKDYMFAKENLDAQAQFALRRATSVFIYIDDKPLIDMGFEDFTHAEIMDDLAACSRGEKGWWSGPPKPAN